MSNKRFGLSKEREVKKMLQKSALYVSRVRGSFTAYDLQAFYPKICKLISIKATKQKYFALNTELAKLRKIKLPDYCKGELYVYYSPNAERKNKVRGWKIYQV